MLCRFPAYCEPGLPIVETDRATAILLKRDARAGALAAAGFPTQLKHELVSHRESGRSDRMTLGHKTARGVDRGVP